MPLNSTLKHVSLDFSNIALKSSIESNTTTKKHITQNSGRTIALTLQDLMHSSILQHTNITFILWMGYTQKPKKKEGLLINQAHITSVQPQFKLTDWLKTSILIKNLSMLHY